MNATKKYDTMTKPALNKLVQAIATGDMTAVKAAGDAALKAGASLNDVFSAVGGVERWNQIVRKMRKAGVLG